MRLSVLSLINECVSISNVLKLKRNRENIIRLPEKISENTISLNSKVTMYNIS